MVTDRCPIHQRKDGASRSLHNPAPLRFWTWDSWTHYHRPMKDKGNTEYALPENGEYRHDSAPYR